MGDSLTPLGALLRACRGPLGWERVVAEVQQIDPRLKERSMRGYESGGVMPPLDKALVLAEYYDISLEELARVTLGRPFTPRNPPGSPEAEAASGGGVDPAIADAVRVLPAQPRERKPKQQTPRSRRTSQREPDA